MKAFEQFSKFERGVISVEDVEGSGLPQANKTDQIVDLLK
jgi:hypothetical protein